MRSKDDYVFIRKGERKRMTEKVKYLSLTAAVSLILSLIVLPYTSLSYDFEGIDLELINRGAGGMVYGDLNLPEQDGFGNAIAWTTEDNDIIDVGTGKIRKYMTNGSIPASVTATVNGESKKIPFEIGYINNRTESEPSFSEDFQDEELNGGLRKNTDGSYAYPAAGYEDKHRIRIENGKLVLHRGENIKGVNTQLQYNFENDSYTSGKSNVMISFDACITGGQTLNYYLRSNNKVSSWQSWVQTDAEKITVFNYNGDAVVCNDVDLTEEKRFKFLIDYNNDTYSVWLGDKLLAKDCASRETAGLTSNLYIADGAKDAFDLYLDNLTITDLKPEPMADITLGLINGSDSNEITENLYLPCEDENGESILWTSENENIVVSGEEGVALSDENDKEGAVTASAEIDGITYIKRFEFSIPAYSEGFSSAPQPILDVKGNEIIAYEENFDTATIERLTSYGYLNRDEAALGGITVEDGQLVITGGDTEAHCHYAISTVTSNISDRLVIEFDATRSTVNGFYIWLQPDSNMASNAKVLTRVTDRVYINNDASGYKDTGFSYTSIKRSSKIAIMIFKDSTFSMWIDGKEVVKKQPTKNSASPISSVTRMNLRSMANMGTLKIDNLRIYEARFSQIEIAEKLINDMTDAEKIIKRDSRGDIASFEYSGKNENKCQIAYSSKENLVNADGTINYPLRNTVDEVTVTVTSPEGYSESKAFAVEIPANYIIKGIEHDVGTLGLMKGENEFVIPAESRGNEPRQGISVRVRIYEENGSGSVLIKEETADGQILEPDADCFGVAVKLAENQLPENVKIVVSIFDTETKSISLADDFVITAR